MHTNLVRTSQEAPPHNTGVVGVAVTPYVPIRKKLGSILRRRTSYRVWPTAIFFSVLPSKCRYNTTTRSLLFFTKSVPIYHSSIILLPSPSYSNCIANPQRGRRALCNSTDTRDPCKLNYAEFALPMFAMFCNEHSPCPVYLSFCVPLHKNPTPLTYTYMLWPAEQLLGNDRDTGSDKTAFTK